MLWSNEIEILLNKLPDDVHGSKQSLPGSNLKAKERSKLRQKAWESIARQIEARNQRTFCLIMASKFYPHPTKPDSVSPDDRINKPSTRQALASMAGACVQFLLPMDKTKERGSWKMKDFFHRVQSALKDLFFAHSGYFEDTKEKVDKWLDGIPDENRPKEVIGITIVRKQKGRFRGAIENTFLPIAIRINVETGKCEMCCAYQHATINKLEISNWKSFSDALTLVSQLSPIKLANLKEAWKQKEVRKGRFMEFVKQVISESAEAGSQPLVIIDSSNCAQLWGWLTDKQMNTAQINFGTEFQHMEQEWAGVRIVRVRQDLAPGAIEKKARHLVETTIEDSRTKKDLKKVPADLILDSASSSTSKLFRLNSAFDTGCVTYLSMGNKHLHSTKRGQSCYRATKQLEKTTEKIHKISESKQEKIEMYKIVETPPFTDQHPTPNPLEIVVTLRQYNDDPDKLAALVESLRYGLGHYSDWAALPAPMFFERVVRDYISEFSIDNADEEEEEDTM